MDLRSEDAPGRRLPASERGRDAVAREFTEWVQPHWPVLHRVAARLCGVVDGEDVLQEALSAAWRKRHQFDPDRGTARAWLVAITIDQSRKHRHRMSRSVMLIDDPDSADDAPMSSDVSVDVWRAVQRLSSRQRLGVVLFYYADLPVAEIAQVMGCSVGTVKSTLSDARRRLGDTLGARY